MLKKYTSLYQFTFQHDDEMYDCMVTLYINSEYISVFNVCSDVFGRAPVRFIFTSYDHSYCLINIVDETTAYIRDPMNASCTFDDLQADDLDDEQAEELTSVIQTIRSQFA